MAIEIPSISEIQQRITSDLILSINSGQLNLSKQVDPTLRNKFIKGLTDSMSAGFDENNDVLNQLLLQIFPTTATDIYLERWGVFFGINRKAAVKASGNVVFSGTVGTTIPAATAIQNSDGVGYVTSSNSAIISLILDVVSITRSGSTATVTTTSDHTLASGILATISGANETEYNVSDIPITVTSATTFQYQVSGTPATPATGTITSTSSVGYVAVVASDFGSAGNASSGALLTLVSPITNIDDNVYVPFEGLVGGLDIESDESLRDRILERTANLTAPFTKAGLPVFIKEKVAGVTRVWVYDATPSAGYVTIYFVRDNDGVIPTAQQVIDVKNAIIDPDTGIKPANTPDSYVLVNAPTALPVDFVFSSLSPDTTAMRTAITDALTSFFRSPLVAVGQNVLITQINNVIYSVVDSGGNQPTFTLTTPTSTITPAAGELPTLGTITYP